MRFSNSFHFSSIKDNILIQLFFHYLIKPPPPTNLVLPQGWAVVTLTAFAFLWTLNVKKITKLTTKAMPTPPSVLQMT